MIKIEAYQFASAQWTYLFLHSLSLFQSTHLLTPNKYQLPHSVGVFDEISDNLLLATRKFYLLLARSNFVAYLLPPTLKFNVNNFKITPYNERLSLHGMKSLNRRRDQFLQYETIAGGIFKSMKYSITGRKIGLSRYKCGLRIFYWFTFALIFSLFFLNFLRKPVISRQLKNKIIQSFQAIFKRFFLVFLIGFYDESR